MSECFSLFSFFDVGQEIDLILSANIKSQPAIEWAAKGNTPGAIAGSCM
jgi:hypothetical protein